MSKHVIVGWGAAGMAAVEAIRTRDQNAQIVLFGEEQHKFYSRPGLAYLLTGAIPEEQLFPRSAQELSSLKVDIRHRRVVELFPAKKQVALDDGSCEDFDQLLLAVGAQAVRPKLEGIDLAGVVTLDTLDDARQILKLARRGRGAVVIGGGITALELAEGLSARGLKTHYLLRGDRYWRGVLEQDEARIVERGLAEEGVLVHHNTEIARIVGRNGKVAGVELADGDRLRCDIVAVAIGIRPRISLAEQAGFSTDRGILVDENMRTSEEHVYAAGDVAQVFDPVSGEYVLDSLWWVARQQGAVAGASMTGAQASYNKPVAFNVTRIGGRTVTIIGALGGRDGKGGDPDTVAIARGDSETWRDDQDSFSVEEQSGECRVRIMIGEKFINGALVMGDQLLSKPLQDLISEQVDIRPIRTKLLDGGQESLKLLFDGWEKWRRTGAVI
ncbi:MAG: FAD-dependent oxidoreductase [Anaerolineales bacterium]|jgi:NAD(P)H-nitrite reductase large subunit